LFSFLLPVGAGGAASRYWSTAELPGGGVSAFDGATKLNAVSAPIKAIHKNLTRSHTPAVGEI
jgi:hypothetical protein